VENFNNTPYCCLVSTSDVLVKLAALLLFEVPDVPGATLVSQSKLVPLLDNILTLVSYSSQSCMLLKCMTIKQTMGLGCA
jgi:hypothetical protein